MPEVIFAGPAGRLEGRYQPAKQKNAPIAIVLHPHPQFGGTMDNKVVQTLARALLQLGYRTVRFNFRGVGQSEGRFDDGRGELDDLRAVAAWARVEHPDKALWLAGFSFGASATRAQLPRSQRTSP